MKQMVNYYNINLYGKTKALSEWQKVMKKPVDMTDYAFLRINDALEYAVRLDRKWSLFSQHNKTLDKIIWQLQETNYSGGAILFPKKSHRGKMKDALQWNEENKKLLKNNALQFNLIKAIIELKIRKAIEIASELYD